MLAPFIKAKYRIFIHILREFKKNSLLRNIVILLFMFGVIYACYDFSHFMFKFLKSIKGAGPFLCDKLINLFFMSIFFLLIFSNAISSYSTIFKNKELNMLRTQPLKYEEIFVLKFLESMFLSSNIRPGFFMARTAIRRIPNPSAFKAHLNCWKPPDQAAGVFSCIRTRPRRSLA